MSRTMKLIAGSALVAGIAGAGTAMAGDAARDKALSGPALDRAVAAALAATRGGSVTETEVGDDGAAYSVEVRLADGSHVEVQLDADFNVVGRSVDDDGPRDQDGADDR